MGEIKNQPTKGLVRFNKLVTFIIGIFFYLAYYFIMTDYFKVDLFSFPYILVTIYFILGLSLFTYIIPRVEKLVDKYPVLRILSGPKLIYPLAYIFAPIIFLFIINKKTTD